MKHFVVFFAIIFFFPSSSKTTKPPARVWLRDNKDLRNTVSVLGNVEMCLRVCVCIPAHHQRLDQDVFDKFKVIALELLGLGAGSLHLLIRVETEELRLVFELALLQHCGRGGTHTACKKDRTGCGSRSAFSVKSGKSHFVILFCGADLIYF